MGFVKKLKLQTSARDLYKLATSPRKKNHEDNSVQAEKNSANDCQQLPSFTEGLLDKKEHHKMIKYIIETIDSLDSSENRLYLRLTSGKGCYVSKDVIIVDNILYDIDYITSWLRKVNISVRIHSSLAILTWN